MKKIFGIVIPLAVIVIILSLVVLAHLAGRKGIGCNLDNEPGVQAGKKDSQIWINEFERFRQIHGKYPSKLADLDQSALKIGQGYSSPNIEGISPYFRNENSFEIIFTFKNDYVCPIGQSRKCTYRSESKEWTCD